MWVSSQTKRPKRKRFYRKSEIQCLCWFPVAILVFHVGTPACHVSIQSSIKLREDNWKTVRRTDQRLEYVVYLWVPCNILFSWLLSLMGFKCIFSWQWKHSITSAEKTKWSRFPYFFPVTFIKCFEIKLWSILDQTKLYTIRFSRITNF